MKQRSPNPWRPYVDIRRGPGRGGWCAYVKSRRDGYLPLRVSRLRDLFGCGRSIRSIARSYRLSVLDVENALRFLDWEARKR